MKTLALHLESDCCKGEVIINETSSSHEAYCYKCDKKCNSHQKCNLCVKNNTVCSATLWRKHDTFIQRIVNYILVKLLRI